MTQEIDLRQIIQLRLLAAGLELQHFTSTAASVTPIPGGERSIVIGSPAELLDLLPELRTAVPAAWTNFARTIADLPAGAEPNVDGMRAKARQLLARERCPHCDGAGDVHRPDGTWAGTCTCAAGTAQADSEGGHHE